MFEIKYVLKQPMSKSLVILQYNYKENCRRHFLKYALMKQSGKVVKSTIIVSDLEDIALFLELAVGSSIRVFLLYSKMTFCF